MPPILRAVNLVSLNRMFRQTIARIEALEARIEALASREEKFDWKICEDFPALKEFAESQGISVSRNATVDSIKRQIKINSEGE